MNKKGQVTFYIIIVALIIAVTALVFFFKPPEKELPPPEIAPIKSFVQGCLERTAKDALYFIGQQGGYFRPKNAIEDTIPYYLYDNATSIPTQQDIQKEIGDYISQDLPACLGNFSYLGEEFEITPTGKADAGVSLLPDNVKVSLDYPITIKKADLVYRIRTFNTQIYSRLLTLFEASKNITLEHVGETAICISCLIDLGIEKRFYVNLTNYGNDSIIFTLNDQHEPLYGEPYKFVFAHKY